MSKISLVTVPPPEIKKSFYEEWQSLKESNIVTKKNASK